MWTDKLFNYLKTRFVFVQRHGQYDNGHLRRDLRAERAGSMNLIAMMIWITT